MFQREDHQASAADENGDWVFCEEPPADDPSVTCILASDVEWLEVTLVPALPLPPTPPCPRHHASNVNA